MNRTARQRGERRSAAMFAVVSSIIGVAAASPVGAQQLLLHFPLDGSAQTYGAAAGAAKVYVAAGGTPPAVVPGRHAQALRFDGTASIAMPFSLDPVAHPQVTVTAWVKLDPDSKGERTVFSAGNGNVPKLSVYGDRAHFVAARGSAMFGSGMPRDEWVFVAGVVDIASARLSVYQGEGRQERSGINMANLYPPSNYRNPDDPSLPATRYVFVGSHGFKQWPARQMAIDDVRVYAGAMSQEQVAALRTASSVESYAAAPVAGGSARSGASAATFGGVLTDESVADLGRAREGRQPVDITYASEEEALAAAERREREAGQAELDRQQNEMEAQRRYEADAAQAAGEEAPRTGTPYPVGEPRFSAIAGHEGRNKRTLDLRDRFVHVIAWNEAHDAPCVIGVGVRDESAAGWSAADTKTLDVGCSDGNIVFNLFRSDDGKAVVLRPSVIGSISVCSTGASNRRMKGIRVAGDLLKDDGNSTYDPASDEAYLRNCETWSARMLCPVNPNSYATGLIVHSNDRNQRDHEEIVGLQLICRQVGVK